MLACLADGDDLSKAELAKAILVRPQSMARLTDAMIDQGLLARTGPGGRGRRARLTMTDRGRRRLDEARPAAWALNQPDQIGLSPDDIPILVGYLETISRALSEPGPEVSP